MVRRAPKAGKRKHHTPLRRGTTQSVSGPQKPKVPTSHRTRFASGQTQVGPFPHNTVQTHNHLNRKQKIPHYTDAWQPGEPVFPVCDPIMSPKTKVNRRVTLARRAEALQPNFKLDIPMPETESGAPCKEATQACGIA